MTEVVMDKVTFCILRSSRPLLALRGGRGGGDREPESVIAVRVLRRGLGNPRPWDLENFLQQVLFSLHKLFFSGNRQKCLNTIWGPSWNVFRSGREALRLDEEKRNQNVKIGRNGNFGNLTTDSGCARKTVVGNPSWFLKIWVLRMSK